MPRGLKRYYGEGHLHFITCSCYRRRLWLGTPRRRDLFLKILEEVRQRYRFLVVGYVVMPEHFHVPMSEPEQSDPSLVMQVLKQRVARRLLARKRRAASRHQMGLWEEAQPDGEHFWQRRFYDFNVWSQRKRVEELRYTHRNPIKRGLVTSPELVALEQLPLLRLRRSRHSAGECMAGKMNPRGTLTGSGLAHPSLREGVGHPRIPW